MDQTPADHREVSARSQVDATSAAWIAALNGPEVEREQSTARLHALLLKAARTEAARRAGLNGITGRELDDLAHQAAADACMSIMAKLDEFRGDSRFTTWAYKFAIFEVSTKFARHAWRHHDVHLDENAWQRLLGRLGSDPEDVVGSREVVLAVRRAVEEELTPRQRHVFLALVLHATPLDVLAAELGSNRNAIYKTMFDARRKLRTHLVSQGHLSGASPSSTETGRRREG